MDVLTCWPPWKTSRRRLSFPLTWTPCLPFIESSEDAENIYGRGSCDAKGIAAAQIAACQHLRKEGAAVGMLFVVGEERDSLGAKVANENPLGCRFLINGEPTENKMAVASKGALRVEIVASGKMAHSAYPELGESAIEKLLKALTRLQAMALPQNPEVGPTTMNIGIIEGGRAPNVIPDYARAQLLFACRPLRMLREEIAAQVAGLAEAEVVLEIPFTKLRTVPGIETHGGVVHYRHTRTHEVGTTRAAGARLHPRSPHRTRTHSQEATAARNGSVLRSSREAAVEVGNSAPCFFNRLIESRRVRSSRSVCPVVPECLYICC